MQVLKRDGRREAVHFDKITQRLERLKRLKDEPQLVVDVTKVAAQVCAAVHDGITTGRLDELAADVAAGMSTLHPDYAVLAARILVSNLQKSTSDSVVETWQKMASVLDPEFLADAERRSSELQALVDYSYDYIFDFFGFKTVEKLYLTRVEGKVVERPQHMWLRVAFALWRGLGDDGMERVKETYELLRSKMFTHASPTLFNAGLRHQQLASCYLTGIEADSVEGIFDSLTKCAKISKFGGGIGLHVSGVRAKGAPIRGTNGQSDGLVPMCRVLNAVASYINQGGRRKGSIAVYIEPHHPDIMEVLALKRNSGDEHLRARDLFYAVWVSDLFMRRVQDSGTWSLFDPSRCPGLNETHGDEYAALYERYEAEGMATRQLPARDVWFEILRSQIETGTPYILYKDACNAKSNQQNLGTIKCSNLCSEIVEYTAPDEVAVCNIGSVSLPAYVVNGEFDFSALMAVTRVLARNLDRMIDLTFYPIEEARRSNLRHRPIGIGVQGLQDVFFLMRYPYDSPQAALLNKKIFECMYYAALSESCELSRQLGPYSTFAGSPASQGKLQYDLWGVQPTESTDLSWQTLKEDIQTYGLRNSLSMAPMPTASTATIFGNTEACEPVTSNMFSRRTLAGEFAVVNKYLVADLVRRGLWNVEMKNKILERDGSIQGIPGMPEDLQALYKTAWELSQKSVIDMAADRGAFVCQSQSMNLFVPDPTFKKLSSMHFYAWSKGLKTGIYYLRSKPAAKAVQVTVAPPCLACSG